MSKNPKPLNVGRVTIGGKRPAFVLGPCVIESEKFAWRMAKKIAEISAAEDIDFIFKASYDKANRTSVRSFRGIGVRDGCEILSAIGRELKMPVTTDVHSPEEAEVAAEKLIAFGNSKFCFTERGSTFGYNNLVADMRSLFWIREAGYRVIFDATHSVQRPGGAGDSTSGDGALGPVLARAAMAAGCDGIFMEVHENPARALSDGPSQIPLKDLPKHLRMLKAIHAAVS